MLSSASRFLTYLLAVLYGVLGALLFFLPEQMAPVFAWKVTPFMTMTIGGWCIGNAWLAFVTARRWDWNLVQPSLLYLWSFGVGEMAVLIAFRDKLVLAHPVAWLYFVTLAVNVLAAAAGTFDYFRLQPELQDSGSRPRTFHRVLTIAFIVVVGFLGIYGLTAQIGDPGTNGGIFPEIMSLFTLRSFAVFYLSLMLGTLPLLRRRNLPMALNHAYASYALIIFISAAIVAYWGVFDIASRPGQLVYVVAYIAVGVPTLIVLLREGTGLRQA